ncbi:D-threo-3-hydroxyaspartate dehydratase-like [Gigantopelta aegis]|uniref:D-threo-3-hydroxyaspartate dehydratase-like n=1 Tax=Gigantopelta aegis TaxID=1735272 RepID=UPI001B88AB5B|nr:D-threo-3-hydroxyaspartate dehydratase-like [Gigantopelta aegis]
MSFDVPPTVNDVPTPCFLVDLDKVKRNVARMRDACSSLGVEHRPHVRCHRTLEGGELQTGGTRRKIVVSTLDEATFFADGGFEDILFAIPITQSKIRGCQKLANRLNEFHVLFDSQHGVQSLKHATLKDGKKWSALLKVDTGHARTGVLCDSEEAIHLAKEAHEAENVDFKGVYTHEGHSYFIKGVQEQMQFGHEIVDKLLTLASRLRATGVDCRILAAGSTPTCSHPAENAGLLTELHPGAYFFYDQELLLLGCCTSADIACRVATRVVSHKKSHNEFLVDAGYMALGHDGIAQQPPGGFCKFQEYDHLRMVCLDQEMGKVTTTNSKLDFDEFPIGKILFIYPYHAGSTASQHPLYFVHSGERVTGTWRPTRGWHPRSNHVPEKHLCA